MTTYITGTSTRQVDDLVKALGSDSGVSKSTVSGICADNDEDVTELRERRLDGIPFVYLWLGATYLKVRENRRVVSKAVVIATAVRGDGHREIVGVDIGDSENEKSWTEFLRDLTGRGFSGEQLVISDANRGLAAAIARGLQGSAWQRCRVHAMRNLLTAARQEHRPLIAALIRTVFAQPDHDRARAQPDDIAAQPEPFAPEVARRLADIANDLLAYTAFPPVHWPKIWSNNPIERLNREIKRRTNVVGIFPNAESVTRLVGTLLVKINDDMTASERRYMAAGTLTSLVNDPTLTSLPAAPRCQPIAHSYTTPPDIIDLKVSSLEDFDDNGRVLPLAQYAPSDVPNEHLGSDSILPELETSRPCSTQSDDISCWDLRHLIRRY